MTEVLERSPDLRVVLEFTFDAYGDPEAFWDRLSTAFPFRFFIGVGDALNSLDTLDELRFNIPNELADVLLSRKPLEERSTHARSV